MVVHFAEGGRKGMFGLLHKSARVIGRWHKGTWRHRKGLEKIAGLAESCYRADWVRRDDVFVLS